MNNLLKFIFFAKNKKGKTFIKIEEIILKQIV